MSRALASFWAMHKPVPVPVVSFLLIVALVWLSAMTVLGQEPGAAPRGQMGSSVGLSVRGSPLVHGRAGAGIAVTVTLDRRVDDLQIWVVTHGGDRIRRFALGGKKAGRYSRTWDGRDDAGATVPNGAYRIVAVAREGESVERAAEWVTVADHKIYPRRPGFITVAVDPGHGGSSDGAVGRGGTREADLNLDIGLRLAHMLEGAGVNVVITRTTDANVNEPRVDLTGDGAADSTDELAARPDIANLARADLYVSVHNNVAVNRNTGGPSTFYSDGRPFTDRSKRLARIIQGEMVEALSTFETAAWSPFDHGPLIYPYYVLRGYDPPRLRRPTQMPGVLAEGLFLSNPTELRLLKRPAVRQAIAEAYYEAIATYLARRPSQVGYELIDGPAEAEAGDVVEYRVEVRNKGNETMRGWRLRVGARPALFLYEGRGRSGQPVGEKRIPRLEPGQKVTATVNVTAPEPGGDWVLLFDARDRDGKRASRLGSPVLQVPLMSVAP